MKYIDAEKLIAEIQRRKGKQDATIREWSVLVDIETFVTTLQQEQPEVDLEKEIEDYCGSYKDRPVPDFIEAVARHFYELGLNARK